MAWTTAPIGGTPSGREEDESGGTAGELPGAITAFAVILRGNLRRSLAWVDRSSIRWGFWLRSSSRSRGLATVHLVAAVGPRYKAFMIQKSICRPLVALSVVLTLGATDVGTAIAASRCLTPPEKAAFHVRMLQTELMVATLTCRGMSKHDFSRQYGSFVETHRAGLKSNSEVFQSHFKRSFGGGGQTQMDRYVTGLANDYSRSSMMGSGAFCEQQGPLFDKATSIKPSELAQFAAERAEGRSVGVPSCGEASKPKPAAKK